MPSRIIRDGILDSDRYWSVTIEARQMFIHMLLLADDFGCISVSYTFLRRRCFNDGPGQDKVAKLLNELQDADLIRLYDADRACFAFIPRFRQRLQRSTLKHPKPPDSLLENDSYAKEQFRNIKNITPNPTVDQPLETVEQRVSNTRREEKRREERASAVRGSRLPPDWRPAPELLSWAQSERPDLSVETTLASFRDHWIAAPGARGVKLDWNATFRNWVRRETSPRNVQRPANKAKPWEGWT